MNKEDRAAELMAAFQEKHGAEKLAILTFVLHQSTFSILLVSKYNVSADFVHPSIGRTLSLMSSLLGLSEIEIKFYQKEAEKLLDAMTKTKINLG